MGSLAKARPGLTEVPRVDGAFALGTGGEEGAVARDAEGLTGLCPRRDLLGVAIGPRGVDAAIGCDDDLLRILGMRDDSVDVRDPRQPDRLLRRGGERKQEEQRSEGNSAHRGIQEANGATVKLGA